MRQNTSLQAVRVLDFTQMMLGPLATQTLADLGADVVKVERPGTGDWMRGMPMLGELVGHDSSAFHAFNRNKRSIAVDLKHPLGKDLLLAIDAATPVAAFRADLMSNDVPGQWDDVLCLARQRKVAFALIPINALMVFMGMINNLGGKIAVGDQLIAHETGQFVLEKMKEIVALMDPQCLDLDPIGILDWMGNAVDGPAYSPFGYGYTNYSRNGYCQYPISFADAPGVRRADPRGTVIGGTGIAVSNTSRFKDVAIDFAYWVASAEIQKGLYFESGGQPGHAAAWESDICNQASRNFFRNTRRTLDTAWLRPRYPGYIEFQDHAGDIVHACIKSELRINSALDTLQDIYRDSRRSS